MCIRDRSLKMQLSELLSGINYIDVKGNTDLNISSLSCDSRRVKKDGLFFCLEGTQTDGHIFAHKAVADGAVALVCGRDVNLADDSVCRLIVSDTRAVMSKMAKTFFHRDVYKRQVCCDCRQQRMSVRLRL